MLEFIVLAVITFASIYATIFTVADCYNDKLQNGKLNKELLFWAIAAFVVSCGLIILTAWVGGFVF